MILKDVHKVGVVHIEDLPVKKLVSVLEDIDQYTITEKIDGSQILFGIDEYGFYTSRETKGGFRVYEVSGYPITFSTTYMRSAHLALQKVLPLLEAAGLDIGDQVEAEVLYGELPNAISYSSDVNHIIFLRTTEGFVNTEKLKKKLINESVVVSLASPATADGKNISLIEESAKWKFSVTPTIKLDLTESLLPYIKKIKLSKDKTETLNAISETKNFLLDTIVRQTSSAFGPDISTGGWIEGVVLRHTVTNEQYKIVDKEVFSKVRNFLWESRTNLTASPYNVDDATSFLGKVMVGLGSSIGHPELGTRQAKKYMSALGESKEEILNTLSTNIEFSTIKEYWTKYIIAKEKELLKELQMYKSSKSSKLLEVNIAGQVRKFSYTVPVDTRTKQVFSELFVRLSELKCKINESSNTTELILLLVKRQLDEL